MALDYKEEESLVKLSWEDNKVIFVWEITLGVNAYTLLARNAKNRNPLVIHEKFAGNECRYEAEMNKRLRYGQICEVKLQRHGPDDKLSESGWNSFIIGGATVVVNPIAEVNVLNPRRSIIVAWEEPRVKPDHIEVVAIPRSGKARTQTCIFSPITMKRLKSGSKYDVLVKAIYEQEEHQLHAVGCESNDITTQSKKKDFASMAKFADIGKNSVMDFSNAKFVDNSQKIKFSNRNAVKPQCVEMMMINTEDVGEQAYVTWDNPDNCDEFGDFEILEYNVEVREATYVMFSRSFDQNTLTHLFPINLGKCYTVKIKTTYEDIDGDSVETTYTTDTFHSRPTKPVIEINEDKKYVHVRWSQSVGLVEHYQLHIFDEFHNENPLIDYRHGGENFNKAKFEIKYFSTGRYYNFEVTATGKHGRSTSNSVKKLIGGRFVPRMATARLSEVDPFSAIVEWEQPEEIPVGYTIVDTKDSEISYKAYQNINQCTMTGLNRGCRYCFKVTAEYKDIIGNACVTNEISTDPRPAMLENVKMVLDKEHPDTAIRATWSSVSDVSEYRVRARAENFVLERTTNKSAIILKSLTPDTLYDIGVAAKNDQGYGLEDCQKIKTDPPPPANVHIQTVSWKSIEVKCGKLISDTYKHLISLYETHKDICVGEISTKEAIYIFENLKGDSEYYALVSINDDNRSSRHIKSNSVQTVPNPVTIIDVTLSSDKPSTDVQVEWGIEKPTLEYEIEVKFGDELERLFRVRNEGSCLYRCGNEGRYYTFRVRAVNKSGNGNWSNKKEILLAPAKVTGLQAKRVDNKILVTWDSGGPFVEYYILRVSINGTEGEVAEKVLKESYTVDFCAPCCDIKLSVVACNGDSAVGLETTHVISLGELKPPSYLMLHLDEETPWEVFHLQWDAQYGATNYQIQIFDEEKNICLEVVEKNSWVFRKALPLKTYRVLVHSKHKEYLSKEYVSNEVTMGVPNTVPLDTITLKPDTKQPWRLVHLSWERPTGAECFKLKSNVDEQTKHLKNNFFDLINETCDRDIELSVTSGIHNVYSKEETKIKFRMANVPKVPQGSLLVRPHDKTPWKSALITWEMPAGVEWVKVKIKSRKQDIWETDESLCNQNALEFTRTDVEDFYEVRVFTGFSKNSFHDDFTSKIFSLDNFPTIKAGSISVELNEEKPWEIADITWEMPHHLTCVKVQVKCRAVAENTLQQEVVQTGNFLRFIRTEKYHTYDVKIFSGCDGKIFQSEPTTKTFTMESPPAVFKDTMKWIPDEDQPWRTVRLKWERPKFVESFKVFSNVTEECITENNYIDIFNTTPKRGLKVKVYSGIGKFFTDIAASKKFEMAEIPSIDQEFVSVDLDDRMPWEFANINWKFPDGVKWVKIKINGSDDSSEKPISVITNKECYRMTRKSLCMNYIVKIYPGYSRDVFYEKPTVISFTYNELPVISPHRINVRVECEGSSSPVAHITWEMPAGLTVVRIRLLSEQEGVSQIHYDSIVASNFMRIVCENEIKRYELRITPGCSSKEVFSKEYSVKMFSIV